MQIKTTTPADRDHILKVELAAFEGDESIGRLVSDLLSDPSAEPLLSLLAWQDEKPVGHVFFSHAELKTSGKPAKIALLAPLAVDPGFQNQGIGGALIKDGLQRLAESGVDLVFVLGHPGYYPRYGFHPAGLTTFVAPHPIDDVNADAWMVQALHPGALEGVSGKITVAKAIDHEEDWRE